MTDHRSKPGIHLTVFAAAILLLVAGTMVTANFMVDLAYGIFDPRIKQARRGGGS